VPVHTHRWGGVLYNLASSDFVRRDPDASCRKTTTSMARVGGVGPPQTGQLQRSQEGGTKRESDGPVSLPSSNLTSSSSATRMRFLAPTCFIRRTPSPGTLGGDQ
jgi:hypothetical protein